MSYVNRFLLTFYLLRPTSVI